MKIAVICFSDAGSALAMRLCELLHLDLSSVHSIEKFAVKYGFTSHKKVCADMGGLFSENDALIFISACGIAVRDIAPHLRNKATDPAVLVLDDQGKFVIPILSGHIGGANALAQTIAEMLGAIPVITTATDGSGKFSCDTWAVTHNCAISSMKIAKEISAAILTGDVPVSSEFPLLETLPNGLIPAEIGELGIFIGIHTDSPYAVTLRLIPRIVTVGIGCRRGTPMETIHAVVRETLEENQIDPRAVCRLASIDVKRNEAGLSEYAKAMKLPITFYTADELNTVPGEFAESEFVRKTVGVGNVCERAAAYDGGKLMIHKTAKDGVTVAAAVQDWRVTF
ncbi:MAG: cobalt-precorrin 5A hydrolase [Clostridia bacterium]|nr:cobalt-precorrin 5A hydrolase [Clostridia bacterium]